MFGKKRRWNRKSRGVQEAASHYREQAGLWALRLLTEFADLSELESRSLLRFVGMEEETIGSIVRGDGSFGDSFDPELLGRELGALREKLERRGHRQMKSPAQTPLESNLSLLREKMGIGKTEAKILEFFVLLRHIGPLDEVADLLGCELSGRDVKRVLSVALGLPLSRIEKALSGEGALVRSGLLTIDRRSTQCLTSKVDFLTPALPEILYEETLTLERLLGEIVRTLPEATLGWEDYAHLEEETSLLRRYLTQCLAKETPGVNILLYGPPGTGKTELAVLLARECGARLFEVSQNDSDGEPRDGDERLKAYRSAQALLRRGRNLLLYDEAEDLFESRSGLLLDLRQENKAWINRTLESNPVPTIWISNRIESIDPAIVRRFDLSVELPIPPKKARKAIVRRYTEEILSEKQIKTLARHPWLAPAVVASAVEVASRLPEEERPRQILRIVDRTLRAQGHAPLKAFKKKRNRKKDRQDRLPESYDPSFVHTDSDPRELAEGLRRHPNARLCFYGLPGTGKSALGRWIARELGRPVLLKKGSDLLSMWVGGTEKNIAAAFAEARKQKAVLIFDEVDSLLRDRQEAQRSWEVTQVNEMLVQMEEYDGIFIATTNLMEGLDPASLRRFDLKLEFRPLKPQQAFALLEAECRLLGLEIPDPEQARRRLARLETLTPGDFAAVRRQSRFRPIGSVAEMIERLADECVVKKRGEPVVGFGV